MPIRKHKTSQSSNQYSPSSSSVSVFMYVHGQLLFWLLCQKDTVVLTLCQNITKFTRHITCNFLRDIISILTVQLVHHHHPLAIVHLHFNMSIQVCVHSLCCVLFNSSCFGVGSESGSLQYSEKTTEDVSDLSYFKFFTYCHVDSYVLCILLDVYL